MTNSQRVNDTSAMKSQLYWLVKDQILYWRLSGAISASEISDVSRFIIRTVNKQSGQPVHLMIDGLGITEIDHRNHDARREFAILAKQPWMGQVVVIVRNLQVQIHFNAMSSAFGMKWKSVASRQLAVRSLQVSDKLVQRIPELDADSLLDHKSPKKH